MVLAPGARLGPYEILSPLGAGGMGEVYKARDTRLDRTVAIKVLSEHVASDTELKQRFEREAKAVSSLNHPHICTLYDVGKQVPSTPSAGSGSMVSSVEPSTGSGQAVDFLVMEYLEGQTLADRLQKGALPLDQALQYAIQTADALDKAHQAGIVHRDLKPGNIMVTRSGVKLLDFGLAKAVGPSLSTNLSRVPTTPPRTQQGTVLGTVQYMAPEQLEGLDADARSDIFAFGAVMHEMLTGKPAFEGKSTASLIAAILEHDPPAIASSQPLAPPMLDRTVRKCLAKEPDDRWQTVRDLRDALTWTAETTPQGAGTPTRPKTRLPWVIAGVAIGAAIIGAAVAARSWRRVPAPDAGTPVRFVVGNPPAALNRGSLSDLPSLAVSQDGKRIVYVGQSPDGVERLFLRDLDQLSARPVPGTEHASLPFLSPDAEWIGFFAEEKLKKIPVRGGAPTVLADAPVPRGAAWASGDTIVYCPATDTGLWRIPANGGEPQVLTRPDSSKGERSHRWPHLLPDGRGVLFSVSTSDIQSFDDARIAVRSLTGGEPVEVTQGGSFAAYIPTGHLLYARAGALWAVAFDLETLRTTGRPAVMLDGLVTHPSNGAAQFSVSPAGSLVFIPGGSTTEKRRLVWVDRNGGTASLPGPETAYQAVSLSPDGRLAALDIDAANASIWIYDIERGAMTRLTSQWSNNAPLWSPDGKYVAFTSGRSGRRYLFRQLVDGGSEAESLIISDLPQGPAVGVGVRARGVASWSPDGRSLAYVEQSGRGDADVWVLALDGGRQSHALLQTRFDETGPRFSPDGRWLAYVSNETGNDEVYVQAFPGRGRKTRVSPGTGTLPVWGPDGRELFYVSAHALMAVPITDTSSFAIGTPRRLFDVQGEWSYDVSRDGRRFLMIQTSGQPPELGAVNVVVDWFRELRQRLPAPQ